MDKEYYVVVFKGRKYAKKAWSKDRAVSMVRRQRRTSRR